MTHDRRFFLKSSGLALVGLLHGSRITADMQRGRLLLAVAGLLDRGLKICSARPLQCGRIQGAAVPQRDAYAGVAATALAAQVARSGQRCAGGRAGPGSRPNAGGINGSDHHDQDGDESALDANSRCEHGA